jgi:hypothetical protein
MNDKDLFCEICNVNYDLQLFIPICMPCGHTMCFPCLKEKYKKIGKIKCKHDEKTFNLKPELYAKNYYIIKLLQNKKTNQTKLDSSTSNNNNYTTFRNSFLNKNSSKSSISNFDNNIIENSDSRNQKISSNRESIVNPFMINTDPNININNENYTNNNNINSKINFRFSGNSKF